MDLLSSPKNPAFAMHLAELLGIVTNPNTKASIDGELSTDSGEPVVSLYTPADETFPPWYAANTGNFSVLLIGGCTVLGHAVNTIIGYQGSALSPVRQPINQYFGDLAHHIDLTARSQGYLSRPKILLSGISLGGALCEHIAKKFVDVGLGTAVSLCTFGAPKPGNEAFAQVVAGVNRARWFCSDDPVPLLPPSPDLLPSLILANNVLALARFTNFVHPAGGIQIGVDSELSDAVLPEAASINATGSLAGWLLSIDGSSASGHHLATYVARLSRYLQLHPDANPPLPAAGPAEEAGEVPDSKYRKLIRDVGNDLANLSRIQNSEPVSIPESLAFKYVRVGRFHLVTFNGATVSASSRERSARAFAREANEWLRSLQRQAVVMPDELSAQMVNYLQRARSIGGGITPVLNVSLPGDAS